jgi:hypothetical protein
MTTTLKKSGHGKKKQRSALVALVVQLESSKTEKIVIGVHTEHTPMKSASQSVKRVLVDGNQFVFRRRDVLNVMRVLIPSLH